MIVFVVANNQNQRRSSSALPIGPDLLKSFMRGENKFVTVIVVTLGMIFGAATVSAEPVRVAMPSKSLTFLNYYLAEIDNF